MMDIKGLQANPYMPENGNLKKMKFLFMTIFPVRESII